MFSRIPYHIFLISRFGGEDENTHTKEQAFIRKSRTKSASPKGSKMKINETVNGFTVTAREYIPEVSGTMYFLEH